MRFRRTAGLLATVAAGAAVAAGTVSAGGSASQRHDHRRRLEHARPVRDRGRRGGSRRRTRLRASPSASRARAVASRASARARPTSPTRRARSTKRQRARRRLVATAGIGYIAFAAANDGISIVVNQQNTWATCLTMAELKKIWEPGSKVNNWNDIRSSFPNQSLQAVRAGHRLGHVRLLHRARQRQGEGQPDRLPGLRGRQRARAGRRRRAGRHGLLRPLLRAREPEQAQHRARGQGQRLRHAQQHRRSRTAAYPIARGLYMYVKKSSFKKPVVQRLHRLHPQEREGDRRRVEVRAADADAAEERKAPVQVRSAERKEELALQRITLPPPRAALPESRPRPFPARGWRTRRRGRTTRRRGRTSA